MMENQHYDRQLRAMLTILEQDYAGLAVNPKPVDDRYYIQAAGMAWKEGTLDALTFLRFGSQMLATTMDRSLHLTLTSDQYTPWHPGFDVRRVGEELIVTDVQQDTRLHPGDRILRLNAISPGMHRSQFQKNFLYAREPEREMWGNVLKMTAHMLVEHRDGRQEDLPLNRYTTPRPQVPTVVTEPAPGIIHLKVGELNQEGQLEGLVCSCREKLDSAKRLIIDLRQAKAGSEEALLPLVPYILNSSKTMSEAAGLQTLCTLYTEENCRRRAGILSQYAGDPEADRLLGELEHLRGAGWVEETVDLWEDVPGVIHPRGNQTVLLMDSFCEGAAESFALIARKEHRAKLLGRSTRGNLDYAGMISVRLSEEFIFTYPMTITRAAREGEGFLGKGIQPDVVVPFTPQEATEDLLLRQACAPDIF